MGPMDSESQGRQAQDRGQAGKRAPRRRFTRAGLLAAGLVIAVFMGVLLGAYLAEKTQPSGRTIGLRRMINRCLVLMRLRDPPTSGVPFGTSMKGIANALKVYANDAPQEKLPSGDKWCDILILGDYVTPKQFVHRSSDSIEGEPDVAMNVNAAGRSISELPPDMVLLFETDFGRERGGRKGFIKDRAWYQTFPYGDPNTRVYSKRWNQVGGPEILAARYHDGQGCWIAFVDTSVKFVKTADLPKLKWKPDPNEK
jgi:hypothetical protein